MQAQGALFSWTLDSHDARGRQTIDGAAHVGTVRVSAAHGGGVGDCENELSLAGAKDEAARFDSRRIADSVA